MFQANAPTPLDINFRVGPFPVRVSPWFFVGAAVLGSGGLAHLDPVFLLVWVPCVFVSILWHELGHAAAGHAFGRPAYITLNLFAGLAHFPEGSAPGGWRRLTVALAGPAAGFLLAGVLFVSNLSTGWAGRHPTLGLVFVVLLWVNVGWGLFNLLPLWPLDGGAALREVLYILGVRRPDVPTHTAGLYGAGAMATLCVLAAFNPTHPLVENVPFVSASLYMVFLFGFMAYSNWQMLQFHNRASGAYHDPDEDDADRRWRGYR